MMRPFSLLTLFAFSTGIALGGCAESQRSTGNSRDMKKARDLTGEEIPDEDGGDSVDLRKPPKDLTGGGTDDEDLADPTLPDDGGTNADLGGTPGSDLAVTTSTVSGAMNIHWILGDGTADTLPVNLSGSFISAYLPTASGFDPVALEATVNSDGTFSIPDVPAGPYYLEVLLGSQTPTYYVTDARDLDLSFALAGRDDSALADVGTTLRIYANFPAGQTWDTSSSNLQLYSANAGAYAYSLDYQATSAKPAAGANKLAGMITPFDENTASGPWLPELSAGDTTYIVLQSKKTAGGVDYITPSAALAGIPSFNMVSGAQNDVGSSGTPLVMASIDTTLKTVNITSWARQTFETLRTQVQANATNRYQSLTLEVQPGGFTYGLVGPNPQVLDVFSNSTAEATPGSMGYGNPYPSTWATYGSAYHLYTVNFALGAATSVEYTPSIFVMKPLADFGPTVGPLVGPVTAPKLDGTKDLKATQTGGDPDNTQLSWTAPSTGSATFYEVYVYRLTSAASQTAISSEARIVTTGTSVTIPPAILISGTYFFTIRAFHAPGSDVTTKPEIRGATYGWADMVSGKVTF